MTSAKTDLEEERFSLSGPSMTAHDPQANIGGAQDPAVEDRAGRIRN